MTDEERRWRNALDSMPVDQVGILWRWLFHYYLNRLRPSYRAPRVKARAAIGGAAPK